MSDELQRWLEEIGLAQHAEIFAANDIDLDVLPELSDEDLKELGLSLGHRRRLQRALADRFTAPPAPTPDAIEPATNIDRAAERRQLTIMFCDLVGSTELSHSHDPEDLRELLRQYHDAVSRIVVMHGGYVANYLGDGILVYFGWPHADEDEAVQAIRAGLDAVAAVRELSLAARVGIASGTVVVGDIEAAGRRQAGTIAGETPNLAARLQTLAVANQVVIGGLVRQLVADAFILDDLGPQALKGITEPVRVWRVIAERSVESRFDMRAGQLTRFIGRDHELALLIDRFGRAAAGEGQAVLLSGEAGIGKSRLVRQLHERLSGTPHTRLRFQCSPAHKDSLLYPVIRHLEYAAGFLPDDGPEVRCEKLEVLLRRAVDDVRESMALLAPLLSLPAREHGGAVELTAEQRAERTLKALIHQLIALAAMSPVLYVLEDAHWIDPTTKELVTQTLGRIGDARVLMLITCRPDFQSEWIHHPRVTALSLGRLSPGQGAEVVRGAGGKALPEEAVARILRRADGVPLYIEEMTKSVVEIGDSISDADIPETLQASLLARLDRLGAETRELAQLAAVIGREFKTDLLGALAGQRRELVTSALRRLVTSQIVLPAGSAADGVYTFRHALLQDAAYQSLLLAQRRQHHRRIAQVLETQFRQTVESEPEIIAQHYTAAAEPALAVPYWLLAGNRAQARYAVLQQIAYFERGLQLARGLPEGPDRARQLLDMLLPLGSALYKTTRRQDALAAYKEAAELARKLGSPTDLAQAALGVDQAEFFLFSGEREAVGLLEAALAALGDDRGIDRCRISSRLGRALFSAGATDRASGLLHDAVDLAHRLGDPKAVWDALVCEYTVTAGYPWSGHQFPKRRKSLDEMLAVAEKIGDPELIAEAEGRRIPAFLEMADLPGFEASWQHKREVEEENGLTGHFWLLASTGAMRAILGGNFGEAESLANQALELSQGVQSEIAAGIFGLQMFTIRREQGRLAEVAPIFRRFLDENPLETAWRPGLALIAGELGFKDASRKAFEDLAANGFAVPVDAKRNLTLCYLAEVCTRLNDAERADQLYQLLLPYRDLAIVVPLATVCCGANSRHLGMLAAATGCWAAAEEHFAQALDIEQRLQAWPWLAHTKLEFALTLIGRDRMGDQGRADTLLAEAAASAEQIGMPALQQRIRSLGH